MNCMEYQERAQETALYKDSIIYPTLGLIDELGELIAKVDFSESVEEVMKEAGDVMWYIAAICNDLKTDMGGFNGNLFMETDLSSLYHNCSIIAGKVKKWMRDNDKSKMTDEARLAINNNLNYIYGVLSFFIQSRGYTLSQVFEMNIEKLSSRKIRGVIHGSGDNR